MTRALVLFMLVVATGAIPRLSAQMDLRQAAGVPLPAADLPPGTVSVRVVRESFANNVPNQPVVFTVNGVDRTLTTDSGGRAQVDGLPAGARVRASTMLGSEQLTTQETTVGGTGIRFVLVGALPAAGGGPPAAPSATAPAMPGAVTLGRDSRVVVDFADEQLNVYYVVQILNGATTPVDLGGPLVFELPGNARGTTVMEGSSPNAKANGARVVVTGPFPPGQTAVNIAYELPFSGSTARVEQVWPAATEPFTIFAVKTGAMDLVSPQISGKRDATEQGQPIVVGSTPAFKAGEYLEVTITGLPSRPTWPRNVALGAAAAISLLGLWAAFGPASRRPRAA